MSKILSLSRYGDLKNLMRENQANPTDKEVTREKYFFKSEKGEVLEGDVSDFEKWSHTRDRETSSEGSRAGVPSGVGLSTLKKGDTKLRKFETQYKRNFDTQSKQKYFEDTIPFK